VSKAVGPSVEDLVAALSAQPGPAISGPVDTTLGGYPAKRLELKVPDGFDVSGCRMRPHLQIWYSRPADKYFVLLGDGTAHVYVMDINGQRQVFVTQYRAGSSVDDIAEMQAIVDSIEIER
jgi:hypothetical protein